MNFSIITPLFLRGLTPTSFSLFFIFFIHPQHFIKINTILCKDKYSYLYITYIFSCLDIIQH